MPGSFLSDHRQSKIITVSRDGPRPRSLINRAALIDESQLNSKSLIIAPLVPQHGDQFKGAVHETLQKTQLPQRECEGRWSLRRSRSFKVTDLVPIESPYTTSY